MVENWFVDGVPVDGEVRAWHANGQLMGESTTLNGLDISRMRTYDDSGRITSTLYLLERGIVTRAQYDEACKTRPELPRYEPDPPKKGRGRKSGQAKGTAADSESDDQPSTTYRYTRVDDPAALDQCRAFASKLLATKTAEARAWLTPLANAGHNLGGVAHGDALSLVEKFYKLGAVSVVVAEIASDPSSNDEDSNHLLVQLPSKKKARKKVFELAAKHAEEHGFEGDRDVGQEYLYLSFS